MNKMNKGIDVDAILKEMRETRLSVARELAADREVPLILDETSEVSDYSIEELIEELELEEDIIFNI